MNGFGHLVAHDLRLHLRRVAGLFGERSPLVVALILVAGVVAFHALGAPVAHWLVAQSQRGAQSGLYYPAIAGAALFVMPWLAAQSLSGATRALYTRGDLDLLLASPLSPRAVFSARILAIAIESALSVGFFLFPVADMAAFYGAPRWLALYPRSSLRA